MGRKALTEAEKAEKAALTAAGTPQSKGPTLEEKIAASQAQADAGDEGMQALMPAIDVYAEKLRQAKIDQKTAAKKLRKLLSA
jgi:soluble cytochrome b562